MAVLSVNTALTTGQANDTFEHSTAGQQDEVQVHHSAGSGLITEESFTSQYGQLASEVTRNGSRVAVSSMDDLRDDDIVRVGDGSGEGIEITVAQAKQLGLYAELEAHVYGETPEDAPEPLSADAADIFEENLAESVAAGDCSARVATTAQLMIDTARLAGVGPEAALNGAARFIMSGDMSEIQAAGLDPENAQDVIYGVVEALQDDARTVLGAMAYDHLTTMAGRYDDVRAALAHTGMSIINGEASRNDFRSLYELACEKYGMRK